MKTKKTNFKYTLIHFPKDKKTGKCLYALRNNTNKKIVAESENYRHMIEILIKLDNENENTTKQTRS